LTHTRGTARTRIHPPALAELLEAMVARRDPVARTGIREAGSRAIASKFASRWS